MRLRVALIFLLALAMSASAENVWILWHGQTANGTVVRNMVITFRAGGSSQDSLIDSYQCLTDTVPRGPQGGQR
jgi:hypothetical protein